MDWPCGGCVKWQNYEDPFSACGLHGCLFLNYWSCVLSYFATSVFALLACFCARVGFLSVVEKLSVVPCVLTLFAVGSSFFAFLLSWRLVNLSKHPYQVGILVDVVQSVAATETEARTVNQVRERSLAGIILLFTYASGCVVTIGDWIAYRLRIIYLCVM